MSAATKKWLGTAVAILLGGVATYFKSNPVVVAVLPSISAFILGALHVPQPSDAPKLPVSQ